VSLTELLSDNLYDVPEDSSVISESDKDDSVREKLCAQNKLTVKGKQAPRNVTIVTILEMRGQPRG
jgi:hypothetical protein